MKKFFSIFAALLFAGGLFAATEMTCAEAREAALGGSTAEVTVTGYVTKVVAAWQEKYKNVSFWMADEKDGGEVFEAFRVVCEKEADAPDVGDKVKVTGTLTVFEKDGNKTPETAAGGSFEIIEKAGGDNPPVAPGDTLSCAEAVELAVGGSTDAVIVKGYVTEIAAEWSSQYKNISFWMADTKDGGQVFQAYRVNCESEENAPKVGDLVWVKGNLKQHYEISEIAQGGTFGIVGQGGEVNPPVGDDPTTCAEAAQAALSVSQNNELYNGGKEYTIEGYVTEIKTEYSEQYNNITFWMADEEDGGNVLQAYRCQPDSENDIPEVGDYVSVTGQLTKYNSTPEFAAGCVCTILSGGGGGEEELTYDYEPDATTLDIDYAYMEYQDYSEDYGVVWIVFGDEEDLETAPNWAVLEFITNEFNGAIPAGTYPINDTEEEGTFIASPGGDDESDYPSYIGVDAGDGYYNPFYLVSGTVTIAENGDITVKAASYYGSDITLRYTAGHQAIDNTVVRSDAVKTLKNGMLFIEKNNTRYNANGQIVK